MFGTKTMRPLAAALGIAVSFGTAFASNAEGMVSFATGGYARGLQSDDFMRKVDTNGDGMISRDEWLAFQKRVFAMLDRRHTGKVDAREFVDSTGGDLVSFATGGYARGLRTVPMMHKIDANGDGYVSRAEFIAYETKVFDMMNTSRSHPGELSKHEIMFATGGANRG